MTKFNRRSNVWRWPILVSGGGAAGLAAAIGLATSYSNAAGGHPVPPGGGNSQVATGRLFIGPVAGLTTAWHVAPETTSIPLGTVGWFKVAAPPQATVIWSGATEMLRDAQWSIATCPMVVAGGTEVAVEVTEAESIKQTCELNVVAIDPATIEVSSVVVDTTPVAKIDETLSQGDLNAETVKLYFGNSIANISKGADGVYTTSVDRAIDLSIVHVVPSGFAPLVEWRVDGDAMALGLSRTQTFTAIGPHTIEVGPVANPSRVSLDTYKVTITSPDPEGSLPEGTPILFTATTDPPGYESQITWIAATKFGTALPVVGQGPEFVVEFADSWGASPTGGLWKWVGVKMDNAVMGEDKKSLLITGCEPSEGCAGTTITIYGQGFGTNKYNLCVGLVEPSGKVLVHAEAILATPNMIKAVVRAVPPTAIDGYWMVAKGVGQVTIVPAGAAFPGGGEAWGWSGTPGPEFEALCNEPFHPIPNYHLSGAGICEPDANVREFVFWDLQAPTDAQVNSAIVSTPCLPWPVSNDCSNSFNGWCRGTSFDFDIHFDIVDYPQTTHYDARIATQYIGSNSIKTTDNVVSDIASALQAAFAPQFGWVYGSFSGVAGNGCVQFTLQNGDGVFFFIKPSTISGNVNWDCNTNPCN